jgi:hypothetical protein
MSFKPVQRLGVTRTLSTGEHATAFVGYGKAPTVK